MRYFIIMYKTKATNTGGFTEGYSSYESEKYPTASVLFPENNTLIKNIIELNKEDYDSFCGIDATVNNSINDSIINTTIENLITDRNEHDTFKIDIFMDLIHDTTNVKDIILALDDDTLKCMLMHEIGDNIFHTDFNNIKSVLPVLNIDSIDRLVKYNALHVKKEVN